MIILNAIPFTYVTKNNMVRTNKAVKKSAIAIATGTVIAAVYAAAIHESVTGPLMMGVSATVGICIYLTFYTMEKQT